MNRTFPLALQIAHGVLNILVVLNWVMGVLIVALLVIVPNEEWILSFLNLSPSPYADRLITGLRVTAVVGLTTILQTIAWALLILQSLSMVVGAIGKAISTPENPINLDPGVSVTGWLAVLLTFILARVFAEGARMRDDLEGTV
jgi:hypothetical protein